jgi:hypothetical protein
MTHINAIPGANESGGFSSLLLATGNSNDIVEIDKNIICPKCQYIVVNPVECKNCYYIICQLCALDNNNICDI